MAARSRGLGFGDRAVVCLWSARRRGIGRRGLPRWHWLLVSDPDLRDDRNRPRAGACAGGRRSAPAQDEAQRANRAEEEPIRGQRPRGGRGLRDPRTDERVEYVLGVQGETALGTEIGSWFGELEPRNRESPRALGGPVLTSRACTPSVGIRPASSRARSTRSNASIAGA